MRRGGRAGRGAPVGFASASLAFCRLALSPEEPPRLERPEAASKNGSALHPDAAVCRPGGIATPKVKKQDPPLSPRLPYFSSGAPVTPSQRGGADASSRDGSQRGLSVLGNTRGREEFALRTRGSVSAVTAPVGPGRPAPPTSWRPGRLSSPVSACWAEPGRGCITAHLCAAGRGGVRLVDVRGQVAL